MGLGSGSIKKKMPVVDASWTKMLMKDLKIFIRAFSYLLKYESALRYLRTHGLVVRAVVFRARGLVFNPSSFQIFSLLGCMAAVREK